MGFVYRVFKLGDPTQFYVGSTKQPLWKRLSGHRTFARKGYCDLLHSTMREVGEDLWDIEALEEIDGEARGREQYYIETLKPPLNTNRAHLTRDEKLRLARERAPGWVAANTGRFRCGCGYQTARAPDFRKHLARKFGDHTDISSQ